MIDLTNGIYLDADEKNYIIKGIEDRIRRLVDC